MAPAAHTAALLVFLLMLAGCNTHTPAPAFSPTPMATRPDSPSESAAVVAFRAQRNKICRKGTKEVAAASVPKAGGSFEEIAAAARRVADLTAATQERLERLDPPRSLVKFAARDAERRRTRVRLLRQLADAITTSGDADALTAKIAQSSASAQAAEAAHRLANCP